MSKAEGAKLGIVITRPAVEHGVDAGEDFLNVDTVGRIHTFVCRCGRTFRTANGRGLHVAATRRSAIRFAALDAEVDALLGRAAS